MSEDFGSLNCTQLKVELSKRGAKTTGKKAELVDRLRAYERNLDFTGRNVVTNVPEDLTMPTWPQRVVFKTITLDQSQILPPIQFEHLQQVRNSKYSLLKMWNEAIKGGKHERTFIFLCPSNTYNYKYLMFLSLKVLKF